MVGSRKLSEVVGSIKEGDMFNYYIIVKSELICGSSSSFIKANIEKRKGLYY